MEKFEMNSLERLVIMLEHVANIAAFDKFEDKLNAACALDDADELEAVLNIAPAAITYKQYKLLSFTKKRLIDLRAA